MKKLSTATAHGIDKLQTHQLTIGLDLGDRSSYYCVLDEAGNIVLEEKVATTPKALDTRFAAMPRSRIALETGMHSPWVSRLLSGLGHETIVAHARNVRLIGESRRKDESAGCPDPGPVGAHRSAAAVAGETSQRASASRSDGDPGTSRAGARADSADQHGAWTDQVVRRTAARLQSAEYESGESERAQSGTATGAGAVAGRNRIAERADPQVQRTHRAAGPGKLSAGGAAEAGERRGHTDRVDLPADGGGRASFPQESRCGLLSGTAARKKKLGTEPAAAAHQQAR